VSPLVSTVIPTFDRKADVAVAVRSALAQTHLEQEIIVVDDGSRDGTREQLEIDFGRRLTVLRTERLGVSGARNHGMAAARGDYIALLDSDDEWLPEKLELQVRFLEARPDFGMVITDVVQIDRQRAPYDLLRRREAIPEDGDVLNYVLRNPALAPSSALFRRRVLDHVGLFDITLPTAEDIDFHLRVALRWKIGVIAEPLTRAMRGHDGLSSLPRTYADYLDVMERFIAAHPEIPAPDRRAGLHAATLRNLRGLLVSGHIGSAVAVGARAARRARSVSEVVDLARMAPLAARAAVRRALR
jgi:glycosyltransferase involved in cell wall biosynthesis